jgi:ABC-type multidrug transport system ATPase subunit
MRTTIVTEGLTKKFGTVTALNRVSMDCTNSMNIVLGPNGAGKSTLLKCMAGLYRPNGGSVKVLDSNPYYDDSLRLRMSLLSDNYSLYDYLTVRQNMLFFGRLYGLDNRATLGKAKELLKEIDAYRYLDSQVGTLSRGTKQKIAFCRSVINDPELLLLDEPTAFLDPGASDFVREFILDYVKKGRTVVFVTQKMDEVTRFNGSLFILNKGRLVSHSDTSRIYSRLFRNMTISIRFARPVSLDTVKGVAGFSSANGSRPTLVKVHIGSYKDISDAAGFLISKGAKIISIDYAEPAIEELFKRG